MRVWTCRTSGAAGDTGATRLEGADGALHGGGTSRSQPPVLDPKMVSLAGRASGRRFLADIERRIRWGLKVSATDLVTYNSVKRSLLKRGGFPVDGSR